MTTKFKRVLSAIVCILLISVVTLLSGCNSENGNSTATAVENGLSAYELAVKYGYEGTVEQWLESLNGKSAYEIAVENGYTGSETQWNSALTAAMEQSAVSISTAKFSAKGELILVLSDGTEINVGQAVGADGSSGAPGKDGTSGKDGKDGISITGATINENGQLVITYSDGKSVNLDKVVGMNGQDGVGVASTEINASGDLVITYTNGQTAVLGNVLLGTKGEPGEQGEQGQAGADGISITDSVINADGELILTFSDNSQKNLGKIVGTDGKDGQNGQDGAAGKDGEDGQDGKDGISVSSASINSLGELVLGYSNGQYANVGKVIGADGQDGAQGQAGADGVGIAKSEINSNGELVVTYTNNQVANLGVVVGRQGDAGQTGAAGADGVGIADIQIINGELTVTLTNDTVLELGNIQGPKGENGAPGSQGQAGADGRGIASAAVNSLGELVITYTDETTENLGVIKGEKGEDGQDGAPGKDGEDGAPGKDGQDGAPGKDGQDGAPGKDGISISNAEITADGQLKLTFSDNTEKTVGVVVGADGQDGAPGKDGQDGAPGKDGQDGAPGKDGIGISGASINSENQLILTFSDNTQVNLGNIKGEKGEKGEDGQDGAPGADGVGIAAVKLENGSLYMQYTNSADFINLGYIKGEDGVGIAEVYVTDGYLYVRKTNEDAAVQLAYIKGEKGDKGDKGEDGQDGAPGKDGQDGAPGQDGVSVVNAYVDDQCHLILEMSDGSQIDAGYVGVSTGGGTTPITYTVTFEDHDGTVLKTQTVNSGSSATPPADPTRDGYTFIGWSGSYSNVTANVTVVAQYQENTPSVTTYTVTFKDYDGTVLKTQSVNEGQAATAPNAPTRDGYTFTGWDKVFDSISADITVKAQYELAETNKTVMYVSTVEAKPGDTGVQVVAYIKNNPGVCGMTLGISYDDTALKITKALNGAALMGNIDEYILYTFVKPSNFVNDGKFSWAITDVSDIDVIDGKILVLTLNVAENTAAGYYPITFTISKMVDNNQQAIDATVLAGGIVVSE